MMSQGDRVPQSTPSRALDLIPNISQPSPIGSVHPRTTIDAAPSARITIRLVWRATRRHWWQILLAWAIGSSGLVALAYYYVKPTYDAFSTIRVEPGDLGLFRETGAAVDFEVFKETQVKRVTNPNVIATALAAHPELLTLPRLARARDAEAEIRKSLMVGVVPRTNLIQVSMSSESAEEAASIVNAMIEAYLKVALDSTEEETERRCRRLREVKEERTLGVRQRRDAVAALASRIGAVDGAQARDRNASTIEQYGMLTDQLLKADLELVDAQATLDRLRAESSAKANADPSQPDDETIAAFYATPQVAEVRNRLDKAKQSLVEAERIARNSSDPAVLSARKRVDDAQVQLDTLWGRMRPTLARAAEARDRSVKTAEARVAALKTRMAQLDERLARINDRSKAAGSDELTIEFARQDLARAEAVLDTVTRSLDQVEFEAKDPVARFRQEYKAKASNAPLANHQLKAMAFAPAGMLLGVLGLVVAVELSAGRVHDPEELPGRLRLPVLGVVPPLPRSRTQQSHPALSEDLRSKRDLDQFILSLDHLRVAICSGKAARGRARRSVLITSATGGEGKTTLAAQLAERCVNAGLLTLLIDADIRRPRLTRMFDLPSCQGLANVLRGEVRAEEVITVVSEAGGFHFLPAGSPRVDPSRLLHDGRLSRLLASARESFDIVIVDAPPVLPVPDALSIGRWVDAAVLAVRFDASRYPLVDRANRRLAAVGVPVIGAVVSGVGGADGNYYGDYASTYGSVEDHETVPSHEA